MLKETELEHLLGDPHWRLNHIYRIRDQNGKKIQFRMNWAQEQLYKNLWYLNVILKARQLGMTTFLQILQLDACLFNEDTAAATIAHTRPSAQEIFRNKIRFAYEELPDEIKEMVKAEQDSVESLRFSNGSSLRVGTTIRSGTYQYLHVSELGYICRHDPGKAEEIRTGALNTVHAGNFVFIESTAMGSIGLFHEVCRQAQTLQDRGADLGQLDYRHHFFPWWRHPGYVLDGEAETHEEYFERLAKRGIDLSPGQRAWYAKKAISQGAAVKAEFPSTPEEAFEAHEGVFFECFDRDLHVVKPFKIPEHWTRFRSEDWGSARPFCIQWYAVASETVKTDGKIIPRGALICYREWYGIHHDETGQWVPNVGVKLTAEQVGKGIVEREDEDIKYHVADPAMWIEDGGPSLAKRQAIEIAKQAKLQKKPKSAASWKRANNMRVRRGSAKGGWDMVRERMIGEECLDSQRPMVYFFGTCTHTNRTIPIQIHDATNPEDMDTTGEDHAVDTLRYACMSEPYETPKPTSAKSMTDLSNVTLDRLWKDAQEAHV